MKINKANIINQIIKEDRNYGKEINLENNCLVIFDNDIPLSNLIYLDDISRILSLTNELKTIYINLSNTYNKDTLNNLRINYNNYLTHKDLENNIVDILDTNNNFIVSDNCLFLDNIKLVDENGNYTDILYKLNYLKYLSLNYDKVIIYDIEYQKYHTILDKLEIKYIKNVNNNDIININLNKDIDKTRLDAISSNIDLNELNDLYQQLNSILYNKNIYELDIYNELDSNIEYNIIEMLNIYKETIYNISNTLDLYYLIDYINKLINLTKEYINNIDLDLTIEKLNLLTSINIILNNSLDLLGIILIYL